MRYIAYFLVLLALSFLTACQPFEKRESDVRERLTALETKGLPDSVIAPARLALVAAQGNKARNRDGEANKELNKALAAVKNAEEFLEKTLTTKKPEVVARYNALVSETEKSFRGLHRTAADSILQQIDNWLKIDFVFRAERIIQQFERDLPRMKRAQHLADSIRPIINGSNWRFTETTTHAHDRNVNAVENKTFRFNRDGTAYFEERKTGQSAPNLRENWRFETWGTWDMKGDTINVIATRFTQHRQEFWQFNELTRKWGHVNEQNQFVEGRARVIPAETLTMADNPDDVVKQNRFIVYKDLIDEFTRQR